MTRAAEPQASTADAPWVGRSVKRKEDVRLLRGEGQYIADMQLPRMLHLRFIRSTHAHARLLSIDLSRALDVPGVVAGFTGQDLLDNGMRPIFDVPSLIIPVPGDLRIPPTSTPLAVDKVVFHGEPFAVLLAEDKYALEDAAELVHVDYEPLPIVLDPEEALKEESPRVYEEWPDNVVYRSMMGNDASEAFAKADVVIEERFSVPRTGCSPMELRGAISTWSEDAGLKHWSTTQRPHPLRAALSEVLRIPDHKVRVVAPKDQGGHFGTKAPLAREDFVVALVARMVRRPVRWIETREEHFRAGVGQERGQVHYLQLAATRDGKILGLRDRCIADVGDANQADYMGISYPITGCAWMPSVYDIPFVEIEVVCVATNKPALTPSRGFGALPARFALDRTIDLLAKELGLDRVEVYRKNLVTKFPHVTPTGQFYDSGDYVGGFDKAVELVDVAQVRRRQAALREQGRYIGVGFGTETEISGVSSKVFVEVQGKPGYGAATVKVSATGKILAFHGDAPGGQSHETTMSQVLADEFGLTPDDVMLEYGDSSTTPYGMGSIGNRMGSYTVSAGVLAARVLKQKMAAVAAHDLGLDAGPDEFSFSRGEIVWTKDPRRSISFEAVARHLILQPLNLPAGVEAGLEHTAYYEPPPDIPAMFGAAFHAAVVEVDPASGEFTVLRYLVVDDAGRLINPRVVEGQVQGGVVMGIGNTIFEEFVYNDRGELQNPTLMDYLMPSAADVPHVECHDYSVRTPHNPLGSRGKGEGAPGPVPGTLANAIDDALAPFGVRMTDLPLRPERIWKAIDQAARERKGP